MKKIITYSIICLLTLMSCNCDIYKGLHQGSWEQNLFGRNEFHLLYITNKPVFYDSFPSMYECPKGFEDYINYGNYKWVVFETKVVDYFWTNNEWKHRDDLRSFYRLGEGVYQAKAYKKVVFPYCGREMKQKLMKYYQTKQLVYVDKGKQIIQHQPDSSWHFVVFTNNILEEDLRYTKELVRYPYPIDF